MLIKVLLEFLDVAKAVCVPVWLRAFIKKIRLQIAQKQQEVMESPTQGNG